MNTIVRYLGQLLETWLASGIFGYILVAIWVAYPVAIVTVFHPSDAVGLQLWLQGFVVPRVMTNQALNAGEGAALLAVVLLSLLQLGVVTLIYRRANDYVQLWPLAVFLVGFVANGIWWLKTGRFDPGGALAGLSPVGAAILCHAVCEKLGGKFVFGPRSNYQGGT